MKALSLVQPWATWIAEGLDLGGRRWWKTIESRTWHTPYRGPIVLCASRLPDRRLCRRFGVVPVTGCTVALANLVDCRPARLADEARICPPELASDDLADMTGVWAWELRDVRRLVPRPVRGRLGLFDLPADAVEIDGRHAEWPR